MPEPLDNEARTRIAKELGLNLQRLRAATGLSQEKVAQRAGISAFTYQKFEKGESKPGTPMNPRLFTMLALAKALDVAFEQIAMPLGASESSKRGE